MIFLIPLILIPLAANWITDWSNLPNEVDYWLYYKIFTKKTPYNPGTLVKKPFTCPSCFSWWMVFFSVTIFHFTFLSCLLPFTAAGIATLISKIYYKL